MKTCTRTMIRISTCLFILLILISCGRKVEELSLESPDGSLRYRFYLDEDSDARYELHFGDSLLIRHARLGVKLEKGGSTGFGVRVSAYARGECDTTWNPVYGERSEIRDRYHSLSIELEGLEDDGKKMKLEVRAYNEGIAFRYHLSGEEGLTILQEHTQFAFAKKNEAWASHRAQGPIYKTSLDSLKEDCERPLLIEVDPSTYLAVGEAGLVEYARMKFRVDSLQSHTLVASLAGEVVSNKEVLTPWRYVMVGETPAQLLQHNYLLENLNESNKIEDTSWIRPGKVIREVTLTTRGGKACVDFAAKYNLQFVEFDAGWYGSEYDDASDASTVSVDPNRSPGPLDLQEVIRYANSKGIGIILYVNRRALEKQLDEILPLYRSWGIAGVKYGFVRVGPQEWTAWLHEAVRKAAENKLMVDIHDEYRPTGFSRTYPNLMTQEGIRGDEESPTNDMVINTIFTRMIAGAGDHTNCYFAERVSEKMGSHASQMAKSICIYSPWQFLFWYDRPAGSPGKTGGAGGAEGSMPELPDLQFFVRLPTVWDQTLVLDGYPGSHALIARRSGEEWFVGALNGTEVRQFEFGLNFLDRDKKYQATLYTDDASLSTRTHVKIEILEVDHQTLISRELQSRNGLAMIIRPLTEDI